MGANRVPILWLGDCEGSGTSGGSGQNVEERGSRTGREYGSRLLQSAVSGSEGDRRLKISHRPVISEQACNSCQFQNGNGIVSLGVNEERGHVFDGPQGAYFLIPIHPDTWPFLHIALTGKVYQFKALCFGLSTASQVFTRIFALVLKLRSQEEVRLFHYFNDWLVIVEWVPHLLGHQELMIISSH